MVPIAMERIATFCAQVSQNLSIITACVPCLKPFLESLKPGMIGYDNIGPIGGSFEEGKTTVLGSKTVDKLR